MASRTHLAAAALIAPVALLVVATFVVPLAVARHTAIANPEVRETLPATSAALAGWDGAGLPPEAAYAAVSRELADAQERQQIGPLARRLNFEQTGLRALLLKTARAHAGLAPPYRDALAALDPRWADPALWRLLKRNASATTPLYLLRSVDLTLTPAGDVARAPADEAIFLRLFGRTFEISLWVTLLCVLIAYPAAYTMARLPQRWANVALTLVLVPFWTSILVRTTAWFILLQREGPVNALLLALGVVEAPVAMIFNRFAVYVAMVHVLLPFAILPLYSVMKGIDPAYARAAASLGAPPWRRFLRVTLPLSMPGVAAAALMVFMLAVGFYITPSLVGGPDDQMVSTFIAFYTNNTINWGMSAALATLLLAATAAIVVVARYALPGVSAKGIRL